MQTDAEKVRAVRAAGTRTKRICSGRYEVSSPVVPEMIVILDRRDDLSGWMAIAEWDRHLYSDVLSTKAAAKLTAIYMLEQNA